jgi:hypothetical protein
VNASFALAPIIFLKIVHKNPYNQTIAIPFGQVFTVNWATMVL